MQIDIDPGQIGVNYPAKVGIVGDAREALTAVRERIAFRKKSGWGNVWRRARDARPAHPEWLIDTLRAELPENGVVFTDASRDGPAHAHRLARLRAAHVLLRRRTISPSAGAIPAAIGAAVALPDRPVVCLSGDGGFVMTCQELATAVRYQLRLIVIVHNDRLMAPSRTCSASSTRDVISTWN